MVGFALMSAAVLDDAQQLFIMCLCTRKAPVSLVVHRHDVHSDVILLMGVEACDFYSHGRKHPPDGDKKQQRRHY